MKALALAASTDALPGPPPAQLQSLSTSAVGILKLARIPDWEATSAAVGRMAAPRPTTRPGWRRGCATSARWRRRPRSQTCKPHRGFMSAGKTGPDRRCSRK